MFKHILIVLISKYYIIINHESSIDNCQSRIINR